MHFFGHKGKVAFHVYQHRVYTNMQTAKISILNMRCASPLNAVKAVDNLWITPDVVNI